MIDVLIGAAVGFILGVFATIITAILSIGLEASDFGKYD